jgi:hypothetical protein
MTRRTEQVPNGPKLLMADGQTLPALPGDSDIILFGNRAIGFCGGSVAKYAPFT